MEVQVPGRLVKNWDVSICLTGLCSWLSCHPLFAMPIGWIKMAEGVLECNVTTIEAASRLKHVSTPWKETNTHTPTWYFILNMTFTHPFLFTPKYPDTTSHNESIFWMTNQLPPFWSVPISLPTENRGSSFSLEVCGPEVLDDHITVPFQTMWMRSKRKAPWINGTRPELKWKSYVFRPNASDAWVGWKGESLVGSIWMFPKTVVPPNHPF